MLPRPPTTTDQPLALFLDFDGTLVHIAERPGDVVVSDDLRDLLNGLKARLDGALAVVSGRRLSDLLGHLAPLEVPAAGSHGLEYELEPGQSHTPSDARLPDTFWHEVENFVAERPGLLLEHKGHGAAVHYRQAPQLRDEVERQLTTLVADCDADFMLQADANTRWTVAEAVEFGRGVQDIDLRWLEEPCRSRRDMAAVRAATSLPICAGQSELTVEGARYLMTDKAIDICNYDPGYACGPTAWRKVYGLAQAFNIEIDLESEDSFVVSGGTRNKEIS